MDVLSLDKDETHDIEVSLDRDAGLLRLLVTVSDSRLTDGRHGDESTRSQRRPQLDHLAALDKYNVSTTITLRRYHCWANSASKCAVKGATKPLAIGSPDPPKFGRTTPTFLMKSVITVPPSLK